MSFFTKLFSRKKTDNSQDSVYDGSTKPFPSGSKISFESSVNTQNFTTVELQGRDPRHLMADFQEASQLDNQLRMLMQKGHFTEAVECGTRVLEIDKRIGDESRIAADYGNLGNVLMALNRFEEAEKIIKEGLRLDEAAHRTISVGIHRYNLGRIYSRRNDRGRAIDEVKKSLDLLKGTDHESTVRNLLLQVQKH